MAKDFSLIFRELFHFFTASLLVFILLEIFWPNIILAYFNLNYLVIFCVLAGLISLIKK
ncbi:MAG: hypothetical protein WC146_01445 [Patescibacteria group bacterium]|jgi:uncharacterized membrane protein